MLFNIILFVLFAAIAYFHYTQGLFSAAISTIVCIVAAMLAIGYHETLATYLLKIPDEADAVALMGIFLLAYLIPRLAFDNLVPGNVRFPVMVDKIGAGALGVVAGLFATGVLAIAAESLPFDPSLGGFNRQTLAESRSVVVQGNGRGADATVSGQLIGDFLGDPAQLQHLWLHQDELVLAMARELSDTGGSLSNGAALASAHPDYPTELFGQRFGFPGGNRQLLVNPDKGAGIKASSAYLLAKAPPIVDGEDKQIRGDLAPPAIDPTLTLAVVRVNFATSPGMLPATQTEMHISPSGVRLVAGQTDYYPIGTMVGGTLLLENRADDPLIIDTSKGGQKVDFLFQISPDDLNVQTDKGVKTVRFKPGSFLEIERYAVSDLSGMEINPDIPQTAVEAVSTDSAGETLGGILRKFNVLTDALKKFNQTPAPSNKPPAPAGNLRGKDDDLMPSMPNHLMGL